MRERKKRHDGPFCDSTAAEVIQSNGLIIDMTPNSVGDGYYDNRDGNLVRIKTREYAAEFVSSGQLIANLSFTNGSKPGCIFRTLRPSCMSASLAAHSRGMFQAR